MILERRAQIRPARSGDDDMHAVGESVGGQFADGLVEPPAVVAQRRPAVDDQERLAVAVPGALGSGRFSTFFAGIGSAAFAGSIRTTPLHCLHLATSCAKEEGILYSAPQLEHLP